MITSGSLTLSSRVVLYTGLTNDLVRRIWEHQNGTIKGFTKKHRLKGWRRSKKNGLVETLSPKWTDLSPTLDQEREVPRRASPARDDNLGSGVSRS